MDRQFMIVKQGRSMVLYAGLLDLAHKQGLKSIITEMLQSPCSDNHGCAVFRAVVTLEADGVERVFTGVGDACPDNVGAAIQGSIIRMAETWAKARALRDAVNIGTVSFEETNEERGTRNASPRATHTKTALEASPAGRGAAVLAEPNAVMSAAQKAAIVSLCKKGRYNPDEAALQRFETQFEDLTYSQASTMISELGKAGK